MTELRGFLATLTTVTALLAASALVAAERPPQELHLVGDHWTAWNPPESFPEGATVYTIVPGDTLWDLAGRFYGDPYLWPQLWEQNRYVLDAHWIYPGDPLLIDVEVTAADEYAESVARADEAPAPGLEAPEPADPFRGVITADQAAGAPVALGAESDVYCSGYIGPRAEEFPYALIGSEHGALRPKLGTSAGDRWSGTTFDSPRGDTVRYDLATGDVVYLDGGAVAGLDPGQLLEIVVPGELVHHPRDQRTVVGRYYDTRGRVRVLSVQEETAIGEILQSCDAVQVGSHLRPFVPQPVPLGRRTRMRPVNFPVAEEELAGAPVIVWSEDRVVSMGQGHLVYVDRGSEQDVLPGDVFTIYRRNQKGLPPVVLGELAVLSVEEHTALGRILESRYSVYVGDLLDRK